MHPHHLNCVLFDPDSGCASPHSIDGVAFGVVTWSTSRISMVQVRQTVLDRYTRSPLQIHGTSPMSQEAPAVCCDTGGVLSPRADGTAGTANEWPEVDEGTTWEDYGPRPQIPPGYKLNEGADYIPFNIHLPSGELKPARYIKLEYGEDPLMYGMIDGDPHQYVKSFQATPFLSTRPLCTYTSSQLKFFKDNHDLCLEIDGTVYQLFDKSAMAEGECYQTNKKKLKWEYGELWQVQHDIWKHKLTLGGCAQHMARAWSLQHIKVVNQSKMQILMEEYKACHRGRQS